ncbi:MAG: hypothetical protein CVU84_14020 [Firmicutes bacterium HGW-Firmicutes-1]|jgi:diguanylate cyclase (GGDEF)-like protein/PAS domain S-box-containing protein|nr:MAG: hypothetical protein CVU84_14020 [Firmicutes bacterium HGW-Firmicutes-1]
MKEFAYQYEDEFINGLLDEIPMPIFYKDNQLIYRYCNKAFLKYFGLSLEEVIDHTVYDISSEHLAIIYDKADKDLIESKQDQYFQTKVIQQDGTERDVMIHKTPVLDKNAVFCGIVGVMYDITQQLVQTKRVEQIEKIKDFLLEVNNSILEKSGFDDIYDFILEKSINAIDNADFGCILTLGEDNALKIVASVGYLENETKEYRLPLQNSFQWKRTMGNIKDTIIINDVQQYIAQEDGSKFLDNIKGYRVESTISAPIFLEGKLFGFLNIDSHKNNIFSSEDYEIVEYLRKQLIIALTNFRLYEEMIYISQHDSLTGLNNRKYFEDSLMKLIARSSRYKETFIVVTLDLDGLKKVNDTRGHLAGDELIRYFSKNIKNRLRASDIVARIGGDEFAAVILYSSELDIAKKMNKLEEHFLDNPIMLEDDEIVCRFSYGIASFPQEGTTYDELIGLADKRMYDNKKRAAK